MLVVSDMYKLQSDPDTIARVLNWCIEAFRLYGHKLKLPEGTNPQKTYHWRYAGKLADKFREWEFDEPTSRAFLSTAAQYLKERKMLHKGLTGLLQRNMLEVCLQKLERQIDKHQKIVDKLTVSCNFINNKKYKNREHALLSRSGFDMPYNIVEWYQNGYIFDIFLALSKSAWTAMSKLPTNQRSELPKLSDLICLRIDVINDEDLNQQTKQVLGNDWRTL